VDEDTLIRLVDRFLAYYMQTADRLTRTARWLEALPGGIARLREIVVDDALGIGAELEAWMQSLADSYACEWKQVVDDPALQRRFRHFANDASPDDTLRFVEERSQRRPADWERAAELPLAVDAPPEPAVPARFVPLASTSEVPRDGGIAVRYGNVQLALFHVAATDTWYATQNGCPHTGDMVLARGLLGDERGVPKVACPQHKKTFRLDGGDGLSDPALRIATFPVRVEDGKILVALPPPDALERRLGATRGCGGARGGCA
jgi:NAD(P)H-dependent nitrite reductase small subunit